MSMDECEIMLERTFDLNQKYIKSTECQYWVLRWGWGGGEDNTEMFKKLSLRYTIPWLFCSSGTRLVKKLSADLPRISDLTKLSTPTLTEEKS